MFRKALLAVASLLAVAAVAPSIASATVLHGAPTLRVIDSGHVELTFGVDKRLPKKSGKVATKITVNGKAVSGLAYHGPHGSDSTYTARVSSGGLQVGSKYPVVFHFHSGTVTLQAKVHPQR
ncbi:MAG: hypothetical protein QOE11_138 [Solirubrobacteraceae bacterium]|jgi:hypothetical protein|nr:hypothetical protein [Solirubrobacteraceae bacterium]